MKIKKKKFVLGTLLTTCSLAIVSSITSTFAWYSYNTKNGMAFTGVATGESENLQIKLDTDAEWKTTLEASEVATNSKNKGFSSGNLTPLTQAEGLAKKDALPGSGKSYGFYSSPTYLIPKSTQSGLKDDGGNYLFFQTTFQFRCIDPLTVGEGLTPKYYAKDVYISFLEAKATGKDKDSKDITKALRLHINQGTTNYVIAPGYNDDNDLNLTGKLNLAGSETVGATDKGILVSGAEGQPDAVYRRFIKDYDEEKDLKDVIYGNKVGAQLKAYGRNSAVATFTDGYHNGDGLKIGTTKADGTAINVVLTLWLEGWDPVVMNSNIGAEFALGIQFEVEKL